MSFVFFTLHRLQNVIFFALVTPPIFASHLPLQGECCSSNMFNKTSVCMKMRKIVVALFLRQLSDTELINKARISAARITEDKSYPEADFKSLVEDLIKAADVFEQALQSPLSETKADREETGRAELERAMAALGNEVETLANKSEDGMAIVHGAGMAVRQPSVGNKARNGFGAERGSGKGKAKLSAIADGSAHEWQFAKDLVNFTNRVAAPSTTTCTTEITGLESLTQYAFFHKMIKAGMETQWEGPVILLVL